MPQVLVKLKKYPQGDKVRLMVPGLHGEMFPVPETFPNGAGGDRGRWAGELSAWLCFCQDFTEDVNCAFEFLLKLTPLLDKADQRCK